MNNQHAQMTFARLPKMSSLKYILSCYNMGFFMSKNALYIQRDVRAEHAEEVNAKDTW